MTPECAQDIGQTTKDKSEINSVIYGCPVYLDTSLHTLAYLLKTQFQYVKDIQLEAGHTGFTKLRDSTHISKYVQIIEKLYYGNNPEIKISIDERSKQDSFTFSGSKSPKKLNFKMSQNTRNGLWALAEKIYIVSSNLDTMAFVIGYHELLEESYKKNPELFNTQNIELLKVLDNECIRIDKFFELRTLHKIIEYCPIDVSYELSSISWRL